MKKILIPFILLAVLGGVGYYQYDKYTHPEKYKDIIAAASTSPTPVDGTGTTPTPSTRYTAASNKGTEVNIQVEHPVNGTRKGVVEIGASGFNSFVVDIDKEKNWELVDKQFGESLAYEGFITMTDATAGLKKYLSNIFSKGVAGRNTHFLMSSGALKNPKTEVVAKSLESMGYVVQRVTPEQEGKYALRALLPKSYRDNSFVVDIGSGNTKISWYEGERLRTVEAYGAKYYQMNVTDQTAYTTVAEAIKQVPPEKRVNCFMIGGVPYQLAKENKGNGRYTGLLAPDSYSSGEDVKLKSGLNIYRAIYETASPQQTIFDWDANFTIGYLLALN